jgi:hypothetical protein
MGDHGQERDEHRPGQVKLEVLTCAVGRLLVLTNLVIHGGDGSACDRGDHPLDGEPGIDGGSDGATHIDDGLSARGGVHCALTP